MPILLDLLLPAAFGFTLSESVRARKAWVIVLCAFLVLLYSYLKYYPQIEVKVRPEGAGIYLNGKHIGSSQKKHRIPFGSHHLRLNFKNSPFFEEKLQEVQTNYYDITEISETLRPKKGNLYVCVRTSSTSPPPPGLSVTIVGPGDSPLTKDNPPFKFSGIRAGVYLVQVNYKAGETAVSKEITDVCVLENMNPKVEVNF